MISQKKHGKIKNIARVQNCHDIKILTRFLVFVFLRFCVLCFCVFVFLCFCVFAFLCFCVFVFLSFCPDITLTKCMKGVNCQVSKVTNLVPNFKVAVTDSLRVGIELPGQLKRDAKQPISPSL